MRAAEAYQQAETAMCVLDSLLTDDRFKDWYDPDVFGGRYGLYILVWEVAVTMESTFMWEVHDFYLTCDAVAGMLLQSPCTGEPPADLNSYGVTI